MGLNKITKPEPLAKTALRMLRQSILANDLTTGVIYNEKGLANDLGISRTPVREALLELSSKRLVKFLPQKGVIINTFSEQEIDDIFEIRLALEVFSIKKICMNRDSLDVSDLEAYLAHQKQAAEQDDKLAFMEADRQYHIQFSRLTGNNLLKEMMQDIRDIMHLMGIRALDTDGRMASVVAEHERILSAIAAGDADQAKEEMRRHLDLSREAVKQAYLEE